MLFNIDDDIFHDYFNLNKRKKDILDPKEALILGNSFMDEYVPYKNYKPYEIKASSEKEKCLLKIRELSFILNDLNLKLDLEPNNHETYDLFKSYNEELNKMVDYYSKKYDVLELCKEESDSYSWINSPWPWEGNINV